MATKNPNMLQKLFGFFNIEVTCDCCGTRYEGDGSQDPTKEIVQFARLNQHNQQIVIKDDNTQSIPAPTPEQAKALEKLGEQLFDQMASSKQAIVVENKMTQVKSVIKKKRNAQEIPLGADGKPRWTQEKEAQLRQYVNQYGADVDMAKEFFPLFEKSDLTKRIKKIMQNKDDSIKAKIRNLIKKGTELPDIIKILNEVPTLKVKKFYDKILFNMEKRERAQDPELLQRVLSSACEDIHNKSTTVEEDVTYEQIALDEEKELDGYFKEEHNSAAAEDGKVTPAKRSVFQEEDFVEENSGENPYIFDFNGFDSFKHNTFDLFDMNNSEIGQVFNNEKFEDNDDSVYGNRRCSVGIFADLHSSNDQFSPTGDLGIDCEKYDDIGDYYRRYD